MDHGTLSDPPGVVPALAVVDVLDRDAQVRQTLTVSAWPLRIGRALDNALVLADPHVAAHHLRIEPGADGALQLIVGETRNGVQIGPRRLATGQQHALPLSGAAIELTLGRTVLRLRLPGQPLAPELPLAAAVPRRRHAMQVLGAAALMLAALGFNAWLDNDPDGFPRAAASLLISSVAFVALWAGAWALLSRTFTRQGRYAWHLRVVMLGVFGVFVAGALPDLAAFVLSWPWLADFGFVLGYAVVGAAFYCHLLAVEPARPRLVRGVAIAGVAAAVALNLWQNQQRSGRLGDELYLSHLYPPALRLARPVSSETFMAAAAALQTGLDQKAREPAGGRGAGDDDE
jgi:hypothetical protein